jgi:hypothetical protein
MAQSTTPWTHRSKGHLPSDRIQRSDGKGRNQSNQPAKQRSPEVKQLYKLISNLQDPKSVTETDEGCFCLAQVHTLSQYVPICESCGLILCELNPPYRDCPFKSCSQALLSPQARAALIETLNDKIAQIVANEEQARRREVEEQKRAAGAFPQLGKGSATQPVGKVAPAATHKVLSLTSKGAVLTTVRKSTPPPSRAIKQDTTPVIQRIRPPPPEPVHFIPPKTMSPWESLRTERLVYIPSVAVTPGHTYTKKRPKKEQQRRHEEGDGPPEASTD